MKSIIIIAQNKTSSFNHAIAERAAAALKSLGHTVSVHDLYAEHFDPVLPIGEDTLPEEQLPQVIRDYLAEVRSADALIFVHPNWWGSPPAILRGWVERVFRQGSVYNFTPQGPVSYIGDKIVQVFSTSNTPRDIELNVYGDPIENFWKTVVFGLLGSKSFARKNFEQIILSTAEERAQWLAEVEAILNRRFSGLEDYADYASG